MLWQPAHVCEQEVRENDLPPNLLRQLLPRVVNTFVQSGWNQLLRRVLQWLESFFERVKPTVHPRRCSRDVAPNRRTPVRETQPHTKCCAVARPTKKVQLTRSS